jgi:cobalamin biosynthesis Mg chelatase CobN
VVKQVAGGKTVVGSESDDEWVNGGNISVWESAKPTSLCVAMTMFFKQVHPKSFIHEWSALNVQIIKAVKSSIHSQQLMWATKKSSMVMYCHLYCLVKHDIIICL